MEQTIGETRMFAGTFAPSGWAFCEGQLLAISQHDALFAVLGTIYGGDGRTTFGLPDLRGRLPFGVGTGQGLPPVIQGRKFGSTEATLTTNNLPSHGHTGGIGAFNPLASTQNGAQPSPEGRYMAGSDADGSGELIYTQTIQTPVNLGVQKFPVTINNAGAPAPEGVSNEQPTLPVNYIISLIGIFPTRS